MDMFCLNTSSLSIIFHKSSRFRFHWRNQSFDIVTHCNPTYLDDGTNSTKAKSLVGIWSSSDNSDFKKYLKANRSNMLLWIVMFLVIMITYHFFSDGDFSFLLVCWIFYFNHFKTLASMTSAFGFILVLIKCYFSKSVAGISIKSMQCYAIVYALRLVAIMNSKAYLPYDAYDPLQ